MICHSNVLLFTDRVRSTTVRYSFHQVSVCPHPGEGVPQGTYPPRPRYLPPIQWYLFTEPSNCTYAIQWYLPLIQGP